jgi:Ni/Co efflux regulator RcnB
MKRIILSLAAAAALAGPMLAAPTFALADDHGRGRGHGRHEGRHEGRWERHDDWRGGRWDRDDDRRDHHSSWDRSRHNGYYYNNRWFYGPPPQAYYGSPYYRPGYTAWRRGSSLPPYYRGYVVRDYYRYHLRRPPPGYAWYRVGDDYLLAAIASGLIFEIIGN